MKRKHSFNEKPFSILMAVMVLTLLIVAAARMAEAQVPPLSVDLAFNKTYYADKERIRATVTVSNKADGKIFITKGFSKKNFCHYIRITDPAGRFLASKPAKTITPNDHSYGPLPFIARGDGYIETAFCEAIPKGWKISQTEDLRDYFDFFLPGRYVAEVLIPAATYKEIPCDAKDEVWQGAMTSKSSHIIYVEGSTKVQLSEMQWPPSWRTDKDRDMTVTIWPRTGWTVEDYDAASIRLNNVPATRVEKTLEGKTSVLLVTFKRSDVFESLGTVETGKLYAVRISGKMRNTGEYFGGMRLVKINSSKK